MCGIVGWVDFSRDLRLETDTLARMTETMRQRGPDAGGTWHAAHVGLGHRRLAVIDIAGGTQPMVSTRSVQRDTTVLVYSGEVYNFLELRTVLRNAGHVFHTRSDTEVVVRAYEEWGPGCVERFNGMFAFAIWDSKREQLFLARDRMGVKPLYYFVYPGGILFASEPKGIMANPLFTPVVDEDLLPILFNPRLGLPGETPLHGLREVQPGHAVLTDRSGTHEYPYWRLVSREHRDDLATTVDTVRELLSDIVRRQLIADVPLSAMLSGGLDSTTISALAAGHLRHSGAESLTTFCVEFAGDERDFRPTELRPEIDAPYARSAAKHIGANHHSVVLDTAQVLDALPTARRARDLPSMGQFDTSMYLLFAAMRERSTVALSAESADEIFAGYPWYHDEKMVWRDGFPWLGDAPRLADCLAPDLRARVRPEDAERDRYTTLRARVPRLTGEDRVNDRMREVLYLSMQRPLTYLLDRKDRMSMAVGLEVRVPFCDHRLVEYVWNIPWSMMVADGRWKSPLRMAAADIVPKETLDRPKSGYPGTHDPKFDEVVLNEIASIQHDTSSPLYGVLDEQRVNAIVNGSGKKTMTWLNAAHLLTPVVEVEAWMRTYNIGMR
jgi:asparagine synthase (glutamine-hydrolysing)